MIEADFSVKSVKKITDILNKYNIPQHMFCKYYESHRYYHNEEHIYKMIDLAYQIYNDVSDELLLAIIFHDIVYDPKKTDNEEQSADLLYYYVKNDKIKNAILDTKTHVPSNDISEQLCNLDLAGLEDFKTFMENEEKIFKEFQYLEYDIYKKKKVELLSTFNVPSHFLEYIENRPRNIGVYAGSFNPFHQGHLNILKKAEKIFDKVIVAYDKNSAKSTQSNIKVPSELKYRQVISYDGLLVNFLNSLSYDVTLIRGIRNSYDLQEELNLYSFLQDMMPDIKIITLFCDKSFEHISSSALRNLEKISPDLIEKYIVY